MRGNVTHKVVSILIGHNPAIEFPRLEEIVIGVDVRLACRLSLHLESWFPSTRSRLGATKAIGIVVRRIATIITISHMAVTLVIINGVLGAVYRQQLVVRAQPMEVGIVVRKETALKQLIKVVWGAVAISALLGLFFALEHYVAPNITLPDDSDATPSLVLGPTPIGTPNASPTPTFTVTSTRARPTRPVRLATLTPTPEPAPAVPPAHCPNPGAQIISPGAGQTVQGMIQLTGTANVPNFQYFKIEMGPGDAPRNWSFIFRRDTPVANGLLGTWNSDTVPPGVYTLRVTLSDPVVASR